jgi:hypothetical protein
MITVVDVIIIVVIGVSVGVYGIPVVQLRIKTKNQQGAYQLDDTYSDGSIR